MAECGYTKDYSRITKIEEWRFEWATDEVPIVAENDRSTKNSNESNWIQALGCQWQECRCEEGNFLTEEASQWRRSSGEAPQWTRSWVKTSNCKVNSFFAPFHFCPISYFLFSAGSSCGLWRYWCGKSEVFCSEVSSRDSLPPKSLALNSLVQKSQASKFFWSESSNLRTATEDLPTW